MGRFIDWLNEVRDVDLIKRFGRRNQVDVALYDSDPGQSPSFYLASIARSGEPGSGAKVMRAINKIADKRHKPVDLLPLNKNLRKYYRQFGYKALNNVEMRRKPMLMTRQSPSVMRREPKEK